MNETTIVENEDVAETLGRAEVYQTLAQLFGLPNDGEALPAAEKLERLAENLDYWCCPPETVAAARRIAGVLRSISPAEFQLRYQRLFGHTISKEFPPYETEYGHLHPFRQPQELADISGFYHAFGFGISSDAKERCDFIGVELEFMYLLALKEAHALARNMAAEINICRDGQKRFLEAHLGAWVPAFATLVQRATTDELFVNLALLANSFVVRETARLGVTPKTFDAGNFAGASVDDDGVKA